MKNKSEFLSENFQFLEGKFSIYLNRRVFVMQFFLYFDGNIALRFLVVNGNKKAVFCPNFSS